jgi:hypothetical protein
MFMNKDNRPTSILSKVSEGKYSGRFLLNQNVTHTLIKVE